MNDIAARFTLDGQQVVFELGQTILQAALAAGIYIPHLCAHPDFAPHGSCKLCTVTVNGRHGSACTLQAMPGEDVRSDTPELNDHRRALLQMLFAEGNHLCPECEKSGNCQLEALAYNLEMYDPHFSQFFPARAVDASHPQALLDFNRCIMCELCVRASAVADGKHVFALAGRGRDSHIVVNSPTGLLGDSTFSIEDKAAHVCPVGAILIKKIGFARPIGDRLYDRDSIADVSLRTEGW